MTAHKVRADELEQLGTDDGATLELESGATLRLRVESDDMPVQDMWSDDCYGQVSKYAHDYIRDAREPRPAGMDGRAEKLQIDRGLWVWWQAPDDVPRGSDGFEQLRRDVRDLLEYGYVSVGLELLEGTDTYGRPIVADAAWLGGVEPFTSPDYIRVIVRDLALELESVELESAPETAPTAELEQ